MLNVKSQLAIAATAAALFASGMAAPLAQAEDMGVKCSGINSCKGTSECKTAKSGCKGTNACKGQGWVHSKTAEECTAAGGKVLK